MEVTPEEVDECFSEVDANNDRVSSAHASVRDLVWILVLLGVARWSHRTRGIYGTCLFKASFDGPVSHKDWYLSEQQKIHADIVEVNLTCNSGNNSTM